MSDHERRSKAPISTMVPQLGSSPKMMAKGNWDMRLLSYITSPENIPPSFKPLLYALVRRDVVENDISFWDSLTENYLVLINSIEGRGRNDQLKAENALKGIPIQIERPPEKPNILDRLTDNEKVHDYERWKEREALGLE